MISVIATLTRISFCFLLLINACSLKIYPKMRVQNNKKIHVTLRRNEIV